MRNYKYLDDLGVPKENQYLNWFDTTKGDKREKVWEEQRNTYGIDERETWNWCDEFYDYCYIHLKMYNEVSIADQNVVNVEYGGEKFTVQEVIDKVLAWFETEYYPDKGESVFEEYKCTPELTDMMRRYNERLEYMSHLLMVIMPHLGW